MKYGFMPRVMSDTEADKFLLYALFAWASSCFHPAMGLLMQFPAILYLVKRCDFKSLPALLVLMLGKSNLRYFAVQGDFVLRFGITLAPGTLFTMATFIFAVIELLKGKYDRGAMAFSVLWLLSAIPAFVISFQAKSYGLVGAWSAPVMAFLTPSVYYWALSMSKTYEFGQEYVVKRFIIVLIVGEVLWLVGAFYIFTFFHGTLLACMAVYVLKDKTHQWKSWNFVAVLGAFIAMLTMLFARRFQIEARIAADYNATEIASADKLGSTISAMANMIFSLWFSLVGRKMSRGLLRILPIIMVVLNIVLVSYAITTQSGNRAHDVTHKYETFSERLEFKLFGDRAVVWGMGWDEIKTPPYVFKDMRQIYEVYSNGRAGMKMLPHNQFITLLARYGLWLGGILSIFIIWVWMRALKAMTRFSFDSFLSVVLIPVGLSIFFIVGISGQSVVTGDIWGNALACLIFPGIAYGHMMGCQQRSMFRG